MRHADDDTALHDYYEQGAERDRLSRPAGVLELERTKEILLRHLPAPPAVVADVGGGPGRYSLWLAERGHRVEHRDMVPLHVQQFQEDAAGLPGVTSREADARSLDLADDSMDAVLLLGPIYHLHRRGDRLRALEEAKRVVRPGGPVFVAAISRWAPRMDGELRLKLYERFGWLRELTVGVERTGSLPPLYPGSFTGYCHRPQQLRAELRAAGLEVVDLVGVEGPAFLLDDLAERMDDPQGRAVVLDAARALERVPELLGIGPHLLATARPPSPAPSPSAAP
jgi:SAM-dependent methyltransferase